MPNHCIEVICHICGTQWCVRGCESDHHPDKALAQEQRQIKGKVRFEGVACPYCGNTEEIYFYNTNK